MLAPKENLMEAVMVESVKRSLVRFKEAICPNGLLQYEILRGFNLEPALIIRFLYMVCRPIHLLP